MIQDPDSLDIDFMFLADKAEAINGKLYVMGGAWDRIHVPSLPGPLPIPISVAISITVPWSLTNRQFTFSLELQDADGNRIPLAPEAEMFSLPVEVGRPPGLTPGRPQRTVLSVTVGAGLQFEKQGTYAFCGMIDGQPLRKATFDLVDLAVGQPAPPA